MTEQPQDISPAEKARYVLEQLSERLGLGDEFRAMMEFSQRPEVIEERRRWQRAEFTWLLGYEAVVHSIKNIAEESSSEQEKKSLNLAFDLLNEEVIGFVFDYRSVENEMNWEFSCAIIGLNSGRSTVIIRHNKQFSEMLVAENNDQALDRLKQVVFGAMDAYGDLVVKGRYLPFKDVDPEIVRGL